VAARLVAGAVLLIVAASVPVYAGCSRCAALCLSQLRVDGPVDLSPSDEVRLAIEICHDGQCVSGKMEPGTDGAPVCTGGADIQCTLEETASGEPQLVLNVAVNGAEYERGDEVSVHVERIDTGEVLVEAKPAIASVSTSELCGTSCDSATASWGP
jgi:hypothetical protein